jgi:ATP-binding cassette, subfamily F, member 3
MAVLAGEKAALEALLATPLDASAFADIGRNLNHAAHELKALEERWLELSGQLEQMQAAG